MNFEKRLEKIEYINKTRAGSQSEAPFNNSVQTNNSSQSLSTLGLFSTRNKPVGQRRLISSTQYKNIIYDDWEITELSSCDHDFFSVVASEINRIQPKILTEDNLRKDCFEFYKKNIQNKQFVNNLNETLKNRDENAYQTIRTDNYSLIQHSRNNALENSVIDGLTAVEGIILCKIYCLPAITEIKIDPENNRLQYAVATKNGYKIFSHIDQDMEKCPTLLLDDENYFFAAKI